MLFYHSVAASLPSYDHPTDMAFPSTKAEKTEEGGWNEPAGFHLIPLPYADDIRAATVQSAARGKSHPVQRYQRCLSDSWTPESYCANGTSRVGNLASDELKDAARAWIDKLSVKNGSYPPDSYPNPGESIEIFGLNTCLP